MKKPKITGSMLHNCMSAAYYLFVLIYDFVFLFSNFFYII